MTVIKEINKIDVLRRTLISFETVTSRISVKTHFSRKTAVKEMAAKIKLNCFAPFPSVPEHLILGRTHRDRLQREEQFVHFKLTPAF